MVISFTEETGTNRCTQIIFRDNEWFDQNPILFQKTESSGNSVLEVNMLLVKVQKSYFDSPPDWVESRPKLSKKGQLWDYWFIFRTQNAVQIWQIFRCHKGYGKRSIWYIMTLLWSVNWTPISYKSVTWHKVSKLVINCHLNHTSKVASVEQA